MDVSSLSKAHADDAAIDLFVRKRLRFALSTAYLPAGCASLDAGYAGIVFSRSRHTKKGVGLVVTMIDPVVTLKMNFSSNCNQIIQTNLLLLKRRTLRPMCLSLTLVLR